MKKKKEKKIPDFLDWLQSDKKIRIFTSNFSILSNHTIKITFISEKKNSKIRIFFPVTLPLQFFSPIHEIGKICLFGPIKC